MAQLPWAIFEAKPVTFTKARAAAERCASGLSQLLDSPAVKTRVLSLLQAFIESLQECEANARIRNTAKYVPCLAIAKAKGVVQIHPSFLGNAIKGVYSYLSNFLMHYNEDIGGVWLTCGKIRQLDDFGYVTDGDALGIMSLRVTLKLLMFKPQQGSVFGKVTRLSSDRASLLVYGIFGVTVRATESEDAIVADLSEGDLVDVDVDKVSILHKNRWIMLSTTMDRIKVVS